MVNLKELIRLLNVDLGEIIREAERADKDQCQVVFECNIEELKALEKEIEKDKGELSEKNI